LRNAHGTSIAWLQEFVRIDTINPPGNESRAVAFLGAILTAEGIPWQSAESAEGRGNLWALGRRRAGWCCCSTPTWCQPINARPPTRCRGTARRLHLGPRRGHEGTGISQLARIRLHRAGLPLNRDVVLVATADEQAGGQFGAGWLLQHHPEIFTGAGMLINEGDGGTERDGRVTFSVEVTQKVPVWLRLTAVDTPGHGHANKPSWSRASSGEPLRDSPSRPYHPPVDAMFKARRTAGDSEFVKAYADGQRGPSARLQERLRVLALSALTRHLLANAAGSNKINVGRRALGEIDCRMRPTGRGAHGASATCWTDQRQNRVLMAFTPAVSPTDTELYRAIEAIVAEHHPGSRVFPAVGAGFTDSHFTRDAGIDSYGFDPVVIPEKEWARIHGNDERISVEYFRRGLRDMFAVISEVWCADE
jgi:acetylornithine deacetylase/succinyl-diaminopimelate desuccinylase-like protein